MGYKKLNLLGHKREPFLFICDFEGLRIESFRLDELENFDIEYAIDEEYSYKPHNHCISVLKQDIASYRQRFEKIIEEIKSGNTYILNLTQPTKIQNTLSLKEIFRLSNAHYKLRYKDDFVCFSPEKFIQIQDNTINTFPMKGTIDASVPDAKEKILANQKEMAEHVMIVDLLRNDLSIVARDVKVEKFRYTTEVDAGKKKLLQVSSHISGKLQENWHEHIGDILQALLPAGSISGAPKKSTVEIIKNTEGYERGFFSGVFGVYDGESLDSGVMIRFIEKTENGFVYKSGGGITLDSDVELEYHELQEKIYIP